MKCYSYRYENTNGKTCSGSFDQCKELVECPTDEKNSRPVCFALAKPADDDRSGRNSSYSNSTTRGAVGPTDRPKMNISHAGCYLQDEVQDACSSNPCLGNYRPKSKNFYCCCTDTGCNGKLIPKQLPPALNYSQTADQSQPPTPLAGQHESIPLINQSVMYLAIVMILIIAILSSVYYRRRARQKRHAAGNNRASNNHSVFGRSVSANKNDRPAGGDGSILVPFRNSFNEDGEAGNHQYGQQQPGCPNSGHACDQVTRMNHNSPSRAVNGVAYNQQPVRKFDLKDIKLLEMVGSGRFGTVHRANLFNLRPKKVNGHGKPREASDDLECGVVDANQHQAESEDANEEQQQLIGSEIAVKIIPNNEYQSWQNELKIYNSSRTRHPNVLTFLGSCESPQTNSNWLLVEYASNGSLHHYLKENPISWREFISISLGIVRGLSHLHDADIAHRDFKSKNVLLRHDLSPCITDFGVASMLDVTGGSQNEQRKKYLQVGTPRYMAPEVLECSVAFTKISFTKIDVYALSLVLWELLSRCHPLPKLKLSDYDDSLVSFSRPIAPVESFMLPPLESSQPATSTPQKKAAKEDTPTPESCKQLAESANGTHDERNNHHHNQNNGNIDTVDAAHSDHAHELQRMLDAKRDQVPPYKVPFEDVVGPNPDINAMRQVVVSDKIRPPIRPEWLFYPVAKLCQAIVDGWEYDHDARISASCFVERIETIMQQQEQNDENEGGVTGGPTGDHTAQSAPLSSATTMTTPMIATTVT